MTQRIALVTGVTRGISAVILSMFFLAGCTPKPLNLSDGTAAGNYNISYIDITHENLHNINLDPIQKPIYESVKQKLQQKLIAEIAALNSPSQTKNVGMTVQITSLIKNAQRAEAEIRGQLILWDPTTRATLGTIYIGTNNPTPAGGSGLIGIIASSIAKGIIDATETEQNEQNAINGLTIDILDKLFPNRSK